MILKEEISVLKFRRPATQLKKGSWYLLEREKKTSQVLLLQNRFAFRDAL